jgi:hypothetical protein
MKYLIAACRVFEKEIHKMLGDAHGHTLIMLDFGYHRRPVILQQKLQEIIDSAKGVDAILLLYGRCGGALNLKARSAPVVIPRVNDCFDLMLGCSERFSIFREEPGTYFLSNGWVQKDGTPYEKMDKMKRRLRCFDSKIMEDIYSGYRRIFFVRTGIETEEDILRAMHSSDEMGWKFEEKKADLSMIKNLFSGEWGNDFIVLRTGINEGLKTAWNPMSL